MPAFDMFPRRVFFFCVCVCVCVYVNVSFLYFSSLFFLFLFLSFSLYLSVVPGVRVWSKKKAVARAGKAVLIEFRLIFF